MTNTQIAILMVLHVSAFITFLYLIGRLAGDKMDMTHPLRITGFGRRMIFGGVPFVGLAIFICYGEQIAHTVGERALPYVIFGMIAIYIACGWFLYYFVPKRLVIPFGIAGWMTSISLLLWYFVFTDPLKHFKQ